MRGAIAKQEITKKILEVFPNSFINEKEIRIPFEEGSDLVQIKVSLTCAKVNIEDAGSVPEISSSVPASQEKIEVSETEKQNVQKLMENLGL